MLNEAQIGDLKLHFPDIGLDTALTGESAAINQLVQHLDSNWVGWLERSDTHRRAGN